MTQKQGFTLIEIVVAIIIIAIMAAIVVPNLRPRPADKRREFISQLSALVGLAWYNAVVTHKITRVLINAPKKIASVQIKSETAGRELNFESIKGSYVASTLKLPANIEFREIFIDGMLESEAERKEFWFVIMPAGLAQEVILNMVDKNDKHGGQPKQFSLVLNPFSAQFTIYDQFQKP